MAAFKPAQIGVGSGERTVALDEDEDEDEDEAATRSDGGEPPLRVAIDL